MTEQASFQLRDADGITIVDAAGEIDVSNFEQLRALVRSIGPDSPAPVIVSFQHVRYLDSHTVEVLVELSKRLNTNRRRLLVVAPAESAAGRILRISNLEIAIPLFESLEEALANART